MGPIFSRAVATPGTCLPCLPRSGLKHLWGRPYSFGDSCPTLLDVPSVNKCQAGWFPQDLIPAVSNFAGDLGWGHLLELAPYSWDCWGVLGPDWLPQCLWLPSLCVQGSWMDSKPTLINYLLSTLLVNPGNGRGRVRRRALAGCSQLQQFSSARGTYSANPVPWGWMVWCLLPTRQVGLHPHPNPLDRAGEYHVSPLAWHFQ